MLTCVNKIVLTRLLAWLSDLQATPSQNSSKNSRTPLQDTTEYAYEFDDCQYCIQISHSSTASEGVTPALPTFVLSLSVVALAEEAKTGPPHPQQEEASRLVADAFKGVACIVEPPAGFQISVAMDGSTLRHLPPADQQYWANNLASIRQLVTAGPLRKHFARLSRGEPATGPVECHPTRQDTVYFIHPHGDSVDVIYPMSFMDAQDAAIGVTMLQEFQTGRQRTALALSPSCSYSKTPPAVVGAAMPPRLLSRVNGGWLVLTVQARHVTGPQLEHVLWHLCTLQTMVGLAVKNCKAMLRVRMRHNVDALVDRVEAAKGTLGAHGTGGTQDDTAGGTRGASAGGTSKVEAAQGTLVAQGAGGTQDDVAGGTCKDVEGARAALGTQGASRTQADLRGGTQENVAGGSSEDHLEAARGALGVGGTQDGITSGIPDGITGGTPDGITGGTREHIASWEI